MAVSAGTAIGNASEASAADATVAFNTTANVPSGARIVLAVAGWLGSAASVSSVSGGGLTWVEDVDAQSSSGAISSIYSADAPSGLASGTTITATFSTNLGDKFIGGFYIEGGAAGSDPGTYRGITSTNDQGAGTGWTTGSMACLDGSLIFAVNHSGFATQAANSNTPTAPSVEVFDVDHAANWDHYAAEYRTISGAGSYTVAGTINRSASDHMTVGVEYVATGVVPPPAYVNASAGSTDAAGPWTHTSAAPASIGNLYIVQFLQDGTSASAPAIDSVTNAENLVGTDNVLTFIGAFDVGSPAAAKQHLYIGRATSTSAMVITGSNVGGDDVYVRAYEFTRVNAGTTLAEVIENATAGTATNGAGTSGTVADTAVTTLGPDRLACNFIAVDDDNQAQLTAMTGATGGTWAYPVAAYGSSTGTDGAIALVTASMPTAGTIDGATDAMDSDNWGVIGFALIGTAVVTPVPRHPAITFQDPAIL